MIPKASLEPLPPIRTSSRSTASHTAIQNVVGNATESAASRTTSQYDIFISHATEDRTAVARPLALALKEREISVWYDEFELRIGDSLRQKIDAGIANSRFGLVVLSRSFFAKGWPQYELDGLVTRVTDGKQVLLPIWHEVSKDEVVAQSPSLADKVALRTSDLGIDEIADEIASVIAERS